MNSAFDYTDKPSQQSIAQLNTSLTTGLASEEVKKRKALYGDNQIQENHTAWWHLLWKQCSSALVLLFLFLSVSYLLLGEFLNSAIIFCFVALNVGLGFYQEFRANAALALLKQYLISYITTLRDGKEQKIKTTDLVPGDIVYLYPGDIVPADMQIIKEIDLMVDQSALTGESMPQKKDAKPLPKRTESLFDATNICFAGTTILAGHAIAVVVATGMNTAFGSIAHLTTQKIKESNLAQGTSQLAKFIIKLTLSTIILLGIVQIFIKGSKIHFIELLMFGMALTVSAIPEALPIVVIFCLSRGVTRLLKQKVLVKRLSAIEDLGGIEILCIDKTGTITENQMQVAEIKGHDPQLTLLYSLAFIAHQMNNKSNILGFDGALLDYASQNIQDQIAEFEKIDEIPFDHIRRRNAILIKYRGSYLLIVRGAAKEVLSICILSQNEQQEYTDWILQESKKGHRVLAIAYKKLASEPNDLPAQENNLQLSGFISFISPLKKSAYAAVQKAKILGVEIKILSGDTPEVCGAIAKEINLIDQVDDVMSGEFFSSLPEKEKESVVNATTVFAHVSPEQKYEIISLLERTHRVGYLGDGINDVPALSIAYVSIAVQEAVDIARNAADIILLKKSLGVIIDGIEEGRTVVINTLKYIKTTMSSTMDSFFAIAISSLFIPYLPMLPLQILLLNLLSDFPLISISTDTIDYQDLKKPRIYDIFHILPIALLLAMVSIVFDFICFALFFSKGPAVLRTCWFIESLLTAIIFIFSIRTRRFFLRAKPPSLTLIILAIIVGCIAVTLPYTWVGHHFFKFTSVPLKYIGWIGCLVIIYLAAIESVKLLYYRLIGNKHNEI